MPATPLRRRRQQQQQLRGQLLPGTVQEQHPPWEDLPDEILAAVARRAGARTTSTLRLVCRPWRAACGRAAEALAPRELLPAAMARAFPSIASLSLARCPGGRAAAAAARGAAGGAARLDPRLAAGLSLLPHLTELRLGASGELAPPPPPPWPPGPGAPAPPPQPPAAPLPFGEGAPADAADAPIGFTHVTDAFLSALASAPEGDAAPPPGPLLPAPPPPPPGARLRSLDLGGCALVTAAGLLGVARLPALRELRLRRCAGVCDAALVVAAQAVGLTRLDLAECPRITNLGIRALAPLPLQDLDISGCLLLRPEPSASDPGCLAGACRLTALRRLAAARLGGGDRGGGFAPRALRPLAELTGLTSLCLGHPEADHLLDEDAFLGFADGDPEGGGGGGNAARRAAAAAGLALLSEALPALRALSVAAPPRFAPGGDAALGALLPCSGLEALDLCVSSPPSASSTALAAMTTLKHLRIQCPDPQRADQAAACNWALPQMPPGLLSLLRALTSLVLNLDTGDPLEDDDLTSLGALSWLRRVELLAPSPPAAASGVKFTGAGLAPLMRRGGLTSLTLSRCFCAAAPAARGVGRWLAGGLARLDLSHCSAIDDSCISALGDLPRLTSLDVSGCVRLGDAALSSVCARAPALAALAAAECQRFTDRGAAQLPRLAASLLRLRLGPLPRLTERGLAAIGALTCLTQLELRGCGGVTEAGLGALSGLRALCVLSVAGCGVGVQGLGALSQLTGIAQIEF
ncbi:MAG: hypothetical protein J3K34DRAFT_515809 [Monoraphidium minutum]|nr:MAG: hypothetical protein J3K34DRAFT_515809 [Monoraphidium minutum]